MSDKNLLNESTVRRFMKLANVNSLVDNFIQEGAYKKDDELEEAAALAKRGEPNDEVAEGAAYVEDEPLEEMIDFDLFEQDEEGEEDMSEEDPMEMDMEMDAAEAPEEDVMGEADISLTEEEAQLLIDLGDRLKEAMGSEEAPEMDAMPDDEEDMMDDEEDMMDDEEEEPALQQEIVNEVLKRVTQRIIREKMARK